jgi:phosphatidylglycerol:prolipoprotein diacylglycerol transferase
MHPTLIDAGWFQIRSYGFALAASFLVGIIVATRRGKRYGVAPQIILDLSVFIILAAVVGSRLLFVLFHLDEYSSPLQFFALWEGGATFFGGLILAIAVSYLFVRYKKLPFLLFADIIAPSIALGVAITRVGCFLSGCCYGKPTQSAFGVLFPQHCPAGQSAAEIGRAVGVGPVHLHPTQLYSSAAGFVIFAILMLLAPRLQKRGATFGAFLALYSIARFTVDFLRFYEANAHVFFGLTVSQVLSVGLFAVGVYLLVRKTPAASRIAR